MRFIIILIFFTASLFAQDFTLRANLGDVKQVINVEKYGATGDSLATDTTAVKNAISAAADGQIIYFPKGEYYLPIIFEVNKNITFEGEGEESVLIGNKSTFLHNQYTGDRFLLQSGATFRNLKFKNWTAPIATDTAYNIDKLIVENCVFDSIKWGAVRAYQSSVSNKKIIKNVRIENNLVKDSEFGFYVASPYMENVIISDNIFNNLDMITLQNCYAIQVGEFEQWDVDTVSNVIVTGNTIDSVRVSNSNYTAKGIVVESYDVVVSDNVVTNVWSDASVFGEECTGIYVKAIRGNIDNNVLVNCATNVLLHVKNDGLSEYVNITNNQLFQDSLIPLEAGIQTYCGGNIEGNTIVIPSTRDTAEIGAISVKLVAESGQQDSQRVYVDNNKIITTETDGIRVYGESTGRVFVTNNNIEAGLHGIYFLGEIMERAVVSGNALTSRRASGITTSTISDRLDISDNIFYVDSLQSTTAYININLLKELNFTNNKINFATGSGVASLTGLYFDADFQNISSNEIIFKGEAQSLIVSYPKELLNFTKNLIRVDTSATTFTYVINFGDSARFLNINNNEILGSDNSNIPVGFNNIKTSFGAIKGNTFKNCSKIGVATALDAQTMSITDNTLHNITYGFDFGGTIEDYTVIGNNSTAANAIIFNNGLTVTNQTFIANENNSDVGSYILWNNGATTVSNLYFNNNVHSGSGSYSFRQVGTSTVTNLYYFGNILGHVGINNGAGCTISNLYMENNAYRGSAGNFLLNSGTVTTKSIKSNQGYVTENYGGTSVADGGTINHGLSGTPDYVICTPSVAGEMVSVTALGATNFTVAIKQDDGTAGTTQTVYWRAYFIP